MGVFWRLYCVEDTMEQVGPENPSGQTQAYGRIDWVTIPPLTQISSVHEHWNPLVDENMVLFWHAYQLFWLLDREYTDGILFNPIIQLDWVFCSAVGTHE